ncbi:amidohydrolase family protein [Streptomyces sp. NPDC059460]|uniref:amidohydrolase family protein n=1 Tax=Streptomyces sp. NPDC059460 TaxID=3346840 RepID=UPI00367E3586
MGDHLIRELRPAPGEGHSAACSASAAARSPAASARASPPRAAIGKWIDEDVLRFGPGERIELCHGSHSTYTLPPEALRITAEESARRGAPGHIHAAETSPADITPRERFGSSVPGCSGRPGSWTGDCWQPIAVHLSEGDISLPAESGAGIAHCPGSNAKLASGTALLHALRAASVSVGLGTDGPASKYELDLWEEARLAMMFSRLAATDPPALTAEEAFLMAATVGGAALNRAHVGGRLPSGQGRLGGRQHASPEAVHVPLVQGERPDVLASDARSGNVMWLTHIQANFRVSLPSCP